MKILSLAPIRDRNGRFIKGYSANPATQFKKGEHKNPKTEFKKGNISWSKLHSNYQNGEKHWNWKGGKPKCLECGHLLGGYQSKYCNSCASKLFRSGEKNNRWNGGITPLRKSIRELPEYKTWRTNIFRRNSYSCIWCGCTTSGLLNADHFPISFSMILKEYKIKTIKDARKCKKLWDLNNGRTLCVPCHQKTPNYLRRKK